MRLLHLFLAASLVLGLAACSDDGTVTDSTILADGPGGGGDGGVDGPITTPDGTVTPDMGGSTAALQTVVDKLTLPTKETEYAKDVDGDGKADNRLGGILGIIGTLGFDTQTELDNQIASGALNLLFEVYATSLTDDQSAIVQFHMGAQLPTMGEYGIASNSPQNIKLTGPISSGNYQGGPGNFQVPVPMQVSTVVVNLKNSYMTADLSSSGMQNGQLNGAIPWSDVDSQLIPAIAQMMSASLATQPTLQPFDVNKDGVISADEVRNNLLLKLLLAPDVDVDGDGTKDAMSVGMAFTSKACTIVK